MNGIRIQLGGSRLKPRDLNDVHPTLPDMDILQSPLLQSMCYMYGARSTPHKPPGTVMFVIF